MEANTLYQPPMLLFAARIDLAGELNTAVSLVVADGRITRIYAIRNPHKLARLDEEATLSR